MGKAEARLRLIIDAFRSIRPRRKTEKIDSLAALKRFTATRAAFIAQRTLYGYVKTRMGTQYPEMFRNPQIIQSLNIAKMHYFAACLSDLAVFVTAHALADARFHDTTRRALAAHLFDYGLDENLAAATEEFDPEAARHGFRQRAAFIDWSGRFNVKDAFTHSPEAIMRWAPISDELKQYDYEIDENSVRFSWIDIRDQFEKHFIAEAAHADIKAQALGTDGGAAELSR